MSKYIKLDEAIRAVADQYMFEATMDSPYASLDIKDYIDLGEKLFKDLPTIEVSEDAISRAEALKAYNEAVDELVKAEMEEFNLGDFTECSFNTTEIKLIARKIADLPSVIPQVPTEDAISRQAVKDYCLDKVDYFRKRIEQIRDQEITTSNHHDGIKKISYLNSELGRYADFATEIDNIPSFNAVQHVGSVEPKGEE